MAKKLQVNKAFVAKYVEDNEMYPAVGYFTEKSDLQKFYKHLSDEQLGAWVAQEGLEYTPNESAPINRMRMAMAVLYKHFPKAPSTKKKSKYADYSLEQLMQMAMDNDVVFETTDDDRILRMRAIMALRASNIIE